jgi:hypothetical protein
VAPVYEEDKPPVPVDFQPDAPTDPYGHALLHKEVVVKLDFVVQLLMQCQSHLFDYILRRFEDSSLEAKTSDKEFVENSVLYLDEKLKEIYPLKGKVEVEIYQTRSA